MRASQRNEDALLPFQCIPPDVPPASATARIPVAPTADRGPFAASRTWGAMTSSTPAPWIRGYPFRTQLLPPASGSASASSWDQTEAFPPCMPVQTRR
jgi:hypothetical protein